MQTIIELLNIIVVLLLFVLIGVIVFFSLMKKGKIKMKKSEADIDYTYFKRKDTREYIKFDAIIQSGDYNTGKRSNNEDGVIVLDDGKRFVAGITVKGFNFYNASRAVQEQTMGGMEKFIEVIKSPVQFRQSTRKVDLNEKMRFYLRRIDELKHENYALEEELFLLEQKKKKYSEDESAQLVYSQKIDTIRRNIESKKWMIQECGLLHDYLKVNADMGSMERYQCYMFEWVFDPILYSASEMTREEIYEQACNELENIGNIYIDTLRNCSVTGRRMTKKEIIAEMRAHNQPLTSRDYPFDDFWDNVEAEKEAMGVGVES